MDQVQLVHQSYVKFKLLLDLLIIIEGICTATPLHIKLSTVFVAYDPKTKWSFDFRSNSKHWTNWRNCVFVQDPLNLTELIPLFVVVHLEPLENKWFMWFIFIEIDCSMRTRTYLNMVLCGLSLFWQPQTDDSMFEITDVDFVGYDCSTPFNIFYNDGGLCV